ncbi:MAG: 4Fe-4S binding protein [Spirochaetales bacterium]|nr:4Fe-4S binding protein [Spirochaetales bacterium]
MDISIEFLGIKLQSPLIIGSGPISYGADGMIRAHKNGAGAVVTKTIRDEAAVNPFPHIAVSGVNSMVNAEKWSDFSGDRWVDIEIPRAKAAGVVVIGSIGHTMEEVEHWVEKVDRAGADMIELVSYTEDSILPMMKRARELTKKPVLVKISPNWSNPVAAALGVLELGADGITAMDSVGPVLRIDIQTRRPMVGGERGTGWLTGAAIKPIALHYVAEIASRTDKPIIGLGGVMNAEDAVEMLMAGASVVGVCTAPMLKGIEYLGTLNIKIEKLAERLGFKTIGEISGSALSNLPASEITDKFKFEYNPSICNDCMRCVVVCPYQARNLENRIMNLDEELCRYCGLCITVCPVCALTSY